MAERRKQTNSEKLFINLRKDILAPPPDLTVSEWADAFRKLSSESSAEPGQWRTERAPYQKEIMDAFVDPELKKVVVMASSQVGKTEIILNTLGYHIDLDPAPIMLLQPTLDLAKNFSKERIAPMLRDTPVLRNKVSDVKSRDSGNTTLNKSYPGGYIALVGANAASGLASRPIRVLLADEIDRFPVSAGTEGDPLSLAEKRTTTFYNAKKIFVSTPTVKGVSRIEKEFELSTKEYYHLSCPSCGEYQPLKWEQIDFETVNHRCKHCGFLHNEFEWKDQPGKWIAEEEGAPVRGFHLNELLSPWKKWKDIIQDFKDAKKNGPETLKVWTNTSLGETWEETGDQLEEDELMARAEGYAAQVPDGVKYLTAAVDVQDDRFEIEVMGWGFGKESWGIEYHRIYGDLKLPEVWSELDEYLARKWLDEDGNERGIACTCIDSGGHFTSEVYRFTAPRESRRIFAIKGQGERNGQYTSLISNYTRTKRERALLIHVGVDEGKNKAMSRLKIEEHGPGYCHFPKNTSNQGYNEAYYRGLTAERLVTRFKAGNAYQVWKKVRDRNEPIDLRVYNTAAIEILNPNLNKAEKASEQAKNEPKKKKKVKKRRRTLSKGVN